jgi:outer membrane usher protein
VKRTRQALLVLRQADGKPVPLGARVHVLPAGPDYSAGLRGEIWLGELPAGAVRLEVSWPAGGCTLDLPAQPGTGAPERIGPLACAKEAK